VEIQTAWRKPVKLPTTVSSEPMKSLYNQSDDTVADSKNETVAAIEIVNTAAPETVTNNQPPEISSSTSEITSKPPIKQTSVAAAQKGKKIESKPPTETGNVAVTIAPRRSEAEFLRLLKTEKMDFYSLAEILRGSSMALYCVLYSDSLAKGAKGCQIRQTDLMMRARINNPATLYKQERWLTALGLINKSVRLGNHGGASYEVQPLEILPLPEFILAQFDSYLSEFRG
jgi:hypothetical protein